MIAHGVCVIMYSRGMCEKRSKMMSKLPYPGRQLLAAIELDEVRWVVQDLKACIGPTIGIARTNPASGKHRHWVEHH